ncbi:hypothetical protein ABEB36_010319 [Hypothenemus hampei]|uniref:Nucleolar protein 14 homolog n=1 Tax=Hypothenemus hampei TaxID=57062 RepID=A0ABD1EJ93_HYPHA
MAKTKNRKRVSVDHIQKKRQEKGAKKTLNPFEMHINKEKMRVLGKKLKNERGLPGVSRAKAIKKRKGTLLSEYKLQHKSNKFTDRRIGEKGHAPDEDKIMARFAALRAKAHNRKNIFNLADDEVLTHKGQTLSEIEKFDDPKSDEEESEDENKTGKLDSNFVENAHFGGGVLSKTGQEGAKNHKQLIEQLIEESKKRKAEKQRIKEATEELTEKLDTEWKDLVQIVKPNKKNEELVEKAQLNDYDKMIRELRFEARGTVSDRLKTEEEIAKEEKEKLEMLEQERLDRMKGATETGPQRPNHRSADDLDDGFVYESDFEENILSYDKDGVAKVQVTAEFKGKPIVPESELEATNSNNEEEENPDSDQDSNCDEQENSDVEQDEDNSNDEEKMESDSEDSLADLKKDESSDDSESEKEDDNKPSGQDIIAKSKRKLEISNDNNAKKVKLSENTLSTSERLELEKAGNDLPFTFKLPETYEALVKMFENRSIAHQKVILERMIKCNHPSLSQGNKNGLGLLFVYVLQYINDLFTDTENDVHLKQSFHTFSSLTPYIFELAQLNPENTHNSVLEVLKEKHQEFRKKKKKYAGLEVLVYLKLVSLLFSTSDFRHQIVTPCFMFIEQMLKFCRVKTAQDIAYGLFLCTLVLEYTALSKRVLPLTIVYLAGILHMAIPKTSVKLIKICPPFKPLASDLVLTSDKTSLSTLNSKLNVSYLIQSEVTDEFKIVALLLTLRLLNDFIENLKDLPSSVEIFEPINKFLIQIPMEFYPKLVRDEYKRVCDSLEKLQSERKLEYLVLEAKKPKALRLYEPKIVEIYDIKRRKVQSKEKAEREKLMHKLKKETKGALREIRRDKAFLARVKINERIQSDKERRARVNKLYAEAANQQSELNAMDRKNKRKK